MSASDAAADLTVAAVDVLDRLHQLLTVEHLYDGWRDELDRAIRDAAVVLDSHDHQDGADEPAESSRNPESGTPDESGDDGLSSHDSDELSSHDSAVKRCPRCNTVKSHDEFGRNRSAHDGLQGWCKPCARQYDRERRAPANTACGDSTSDVPTEALAEDGKTRSARQLTEPTGQPPEPDPDTPAPAHARGVARTVPAMRRVT